MSPAEKLKRLRSEVRRRQKRQAEHHQRIETARATAIDWSKLTFEERMELRAQRRQTPEYLQERAERIEAIERRRRHREIWAAIHASKAAEAQARQLRVSPAFSKHS